MKDLTRCTLLPQGDLLPRIKALEGIMLFCPRLEREVKIEVVNDNETLTVFDPHLGQHTEGVLPSQMAPALLRLLEGGNIPHEQQLRNVTDTRMGIPTKGRVLSRVGVQEMAEKFSGPVLLYYFDFKNMGIPNQMGLSWQLNDLLAQLPGRVSSTLKDFVHEFIRLGGDEMLVMVEDKSGAIGVLQAMEETIINLRDECLSSADPKIEKSERGARVRGVMRELRAGYFGYTLGGRREYSEYGFETYLTEFAENMKLLPLSDEEATAFEAKEGISWDKLVMFRTGFLQRLIAKYIISAEKEGDLGKSDREKVMQPMAVIVRIEGKLTPEAILSATEEGEGVIIKAKENGVGKTNFRSPLSHREGNISPELEAEISSFAEQEAVHEIFVASIQQLKMKSPSKERDDQIETLEIRERGGRSADSAVPKVW